MYCHLQGQKGEQGKPGLAGRQGAKVLSNGFVVAYEDKAYFGVIISFYYSLCMQYVLFYLKDDK